MFIRSCKATGLRSAKKEHSTFFKKNDISAHRTGKKTIQRDEFRGGQSNYSSLNWEVDALNKSKISEGWRGKSLGQNHWLELQKLKATDFKGLSVVYTKIKMTQSKLRGDALEKYKEEVDSELNKRLNYMPKDTFLMFDENIGQYRIIKKTDKEYKDWYIDNNIKFYSGVLSKSVNIFEVDDSLLSEVKAIYKNGKALSFPAQSIAGAGNQVIYSGGKRYEGIIGFTSPSGPKQFFVKKSNGFIYPTDRKLYVILNQRTVPNLVDCKKYCVQWIKDMKSTGELMRLTGAFANIISHNSVVDGVNMGASTPPVQSRNSLKQHYTGSAKQQNVNSSHSNSKFSHNQRSSVIKEIQPPKGFNLINGLSQLQPPKGFKTHPSGLYVPIKK